MNTGPVQAVTSGLDKLMQHLEESNARRGWTPLANAQRAAKENDEAWDAKLTAEAAPYWNANTHDEAYWRSVLGGRISEATFNELMRSLGLR
jgi:hypothetical protein